MAGRSRRLAVDPPQEVSNPGLPIMPPMSPSASILCLSLLTTAASAALTDNLVAYFDFEETEALGGLNNKAPGTTGLHAIRYNGGTFDSSANPSGPGFIGKADFDSGVGLSDRSGLHVGRALNLGATRGDAIVVPTGTPELGQSFTISAWHSLTPGAANPATRYHVFESAAGYDTSWGTSNTTFASPQPAYTYLAYVGEGPAGGFGPGGISTGPWHHVAHVFLSSGTQTRLTVFLDGVLIDSRTTTTANMDFGALHFGRARTGTAGRDWDGMLDEVAVWNRALTEVDVAELYQRGAAGYALTTDLGSQGRAFVGVSVSDPAMGVATGSGMYALNEMAAVAAVANPGYRFITWSAPFAAQPESYSFQVTGSVRIQASFGPDLADPDGDGLTNYQEVIIHHTDPALADTDGDLLSDGAEVQQTLTNPLLSQEAAVQWIMANLGGPGGSGPTLTRNTTTNTLSFRLDLRESGTLSGESWNPWSFAASGVAVTTPEGRLKVSLPGTLDRQRFFRFEGKAAP